MKFDTKAAYRGTNGTASMRMTRVEAESALDACAHAVKVIEKLGCNPGDIIHLGAEISAIHEVK